MSEMKTREEFYALPGMKNLKTTIVAEAIVLYACAGLTALFGMASSDIMTWIVDALLLVGLGLWLHLGKSRVCAILILSYSLLNMAGSYLMIGRMQGIMILLAGIASVQATFKYHGLWNRYRKTGQLPAEVLREGR